MSNKKILKIGDQTETQVRSWEFGKTKEKQTKYVRINFNGYITKTIWPYSSPKAKKQAFEVLETLGFRGKDLTMLRNKDALNMSKHFLVTISEVRNVNDKRYYEASWVNDPEKIFSGFKSEMTDDELDEYAMDTSAYIEDAQDIDPPASSDSPPTSQNFSSDDIPF